jgi:hypothetical protein
MTGNGVAIWFEVDELDAVVRGSQQVGSPFPRGRRRVVPSNS